MYFWVIHELEEMLFIMLVSKSLVHVGISGHFPDNIVNDFDEPYR